MTLTVKPGMWCVLCRKSAMNFELELAFYVAATIGCGFFFMWLTRSILRLRKHAHAQNNALTVLTLSAEETRRDLHVIRRALGVPSPHESL